MAHSVAKELMMRPNDILDNWGVPELIVAYGHYSNNRARIAFEEWLTMNNPKRSKNVKPREFAVEFIREFEDEEEESD